jgi:hypothetical protein
MDAATKPNTVGVTSNRTHDLWLGNSVLTIAIPRDGNMFGPDAKGVSALTGMIRDLSLAAKSVTYRVENDTTDNAEFLSWPLEGISDTIILLSQLAEAVNQEINEQPSRDSKES